MREMKGSELEKLCKQYPDFDFQFIFTDGDNGRFLNVRCFENLELNDIGYSDKVVLITGEET